MRVRRITVGRPVPEGLAGAVLTRDLRIGGERWTKGRRLSAEDLAAIETAPAGDLITVLLLDRADVHEDDAARELAVAVAGQGLEVRGPVQSRVDLIATFPGVVHVRVRTLERVNRIDPLEVFTVHDGRIVDAGDLVASVKVAPHVVPRRIIRDAARLIRDGGHELVRIAPYRPMRVAVLVKESVRDADRERFEASVRAKVEGLGSTVASIDYVEDEPAAVMARLGPLTRGSGRVPLILTAGAASTDPTDAIFVALEQLGGRMVRRGVPAHPGSMLWLARIGRTALLGLPTCGAYSMATAVDLLLPRLLSGEPATIRTVAKLGHGGYPHARPALALPAVRPRARRAGGLITRASLRSRGLGRMEPRRLV